MKLSTTISVNITNDRTLLAARDNREKLAACSGHDFEPVTDGQMRYRCKHCGGVMDVATMNTYTQGLAHGAIRAIAARA